MKKDKLRISTPPEAANRILECLSNAWGPFSGGGGGSALEKAAETLDAAAAEISLFDKNTGDLALAASCGIKNPGKTAKPPGKRLPGLSIRSFPCRSRGGMQTAASLPLSKDGEMLGMLSFYFREPRKIYEDELDFLNVLVKLLSGRIYQRTAKTKDNMTSQLEIAKVLIKVMEEKDPYTSGHSERVKDYAVKIGGKMQLEAEDRSALSEFSILHDIGKITIDSHILNRPCGLSSDEWALVKEHPLTGERIVSSADGFSTSVPMIRHHHERLDGSGYPDGLKGDEIPLLARIISVCDAFDAMVSRRAYRDALPALSARKELLRNSSGQFDGEIASTMAGLLDSGEIRIPAAEPYKL